MGTPLYMAPEQAMGHPSERFADIYACGVILYEMLAGKPPFEGQTYAVLVAKLLTQDPPLLSAMRPGLPGALVSAVHRALEKEPKERFQTAEQFLMALPGEKTPSMIELAGTLDSSSGAVAVAPPTTMKRKPGKRAKWPLFVLLAAVVAGAGVVTMIVMNKQPEAAKPPTTIANNVASAAPQQPAPPSRVPQVAVGQLQIKSVPSGAMVSIDGQDKGPTPIEITLNPGRYKVKVALDGFDAIESEEDVRAQERTSVVLPLQKKAEPVANKRTPGSPRKGFVAAPAKDKDKAAPVTEPVKEPTKEPVKEPVKDKTVKSSGGAKPNPY